MIEEVEKTGDADTYVKSVLDSHGRLMGFGHRVYRAEDPRARVLRRTARELGAPRYEVAAALETAALAELPGPQDRSALRRPYCDPVPQTHELKSWPVYFAPLWAGIKTFEIRLRVDNHDRILALGMTASVLLPVP